jgi:hypothetical protein
MLLRFFLGCSFLFLLADLLFFLFLLLGLFLFLFG